MLDGYNLWQYIVGKFMKSGVIGFYVEGFWADYFCNFWTPYESFISGGW